MVAMTPSPEDWRDVWIYFALVDRFNNPTAEPAHTWDSPYSAFQGGTLPGLTAQLPYIRDLGAGAVWLSPVLQNVVSNAGTYHGYGIQNFSRVDPRFCADIARAHTDAAYADSQLRDLVDAAHSFGLSVILDIVINHTGDVFEYDGFGSTAPWRDHPPYPTHWRDAAGQPNPAWAEAPADAPADAAVHPQALLHNDAFRRLGNAFDAPPEHDPTAAGDFYSLKEMVTSLQDDVGRFVVRDVLIDCYADIISRFDIDGYRIDTLMYVERDFALTFGNAMREHAASIGKKNFFTFGEVYADEQKISAYVGRHAGDEDLVGVDASLDFPLFYVLPWICKGLAPPQAMIDMYTLRRRLEDGVISSHGDASRYFVTFADNHDQHSRLRYEDPADPHLYDPQVSLTLAVLLSLQGVPCVYYGTETGLTSSGDQPEVVRQALWGAPDAFDLAQQPFASTLQALSSLRAARPELRYGRQYFRPVSGNGSDFGHSPFPGGIIAFSRILAASEVVVVGNTSSTQTFSGHVLVDRNLTPPGTQPSVRYSNQADAAAPGAAVMRPAGSVSVTDGVSHSVGPLCTIEIMLRPMEIQILTP